MTLELLLVAVPAAVAAGWMWWRRKREIVASLPTPTIIHTRVIVKQPAPKPPVVNKQLQFRADVAIGDAPIDGVGWLGPDGQFHGNGGGTHYDCAYRLLEPAAWWARRAPDPLRNFELELEQRRFVKLIRNAYYSGWSRPTGWRLSHAQRDEVVNWYVMHARQMPDWLKEMMQQ